MGGGGAAKMATQAIPPSPKIRNPPPQKIGGIWRSRQFPAWQGFSKSPKCRQNVARMSPKCRQGKSCDKWGAGGEVANFPPIL
jgi:hypothetical protein